ncbi:hypothetical protein ALC53_09323 [Atta colombica]|uniref:Uncharacterized protein n=1 Tax=Atta colombica TaxID=520822 RepID=A0A195B7Q6_9HYME|nr:hypothetical protein ALC53_09323 [Atta colombica]
MRVEKDIAPDQTAIYRPLFAPSYAFSFRLPVRSNFSRKQMISGKSALRRLLHLKKCSREVALSRARTTHMFVRRRVINRRVFRKISQIALEPEIIRASPHDGEKNPRIPVISRR